MASIIKASINLNEIPKDKIYVGKKGKYLPITITINDEVDQFGNQGPVVVEQSKEEREAKVAKVYLGNVKILVEHSVKKDGEFLLVVRPEKLFLTNDNSENCNTFTGNVVESIYQGESQLLMIKLDPATHGDQILRMRIPNGTASLQELPAIGSSVTVGLKKSDSFLVE